MSGYIEVGEPLDAEQLAARAIEYLHSAVPGLRLRDGDLETWLIYALCNVVAEGVAVARKIPPEIYRYFGQSLLGLAPVASARATATTAWTMIDAAGYTVPSGTLVAYTNEQGALIPFRLVDGFTIEAGNNSISGVVVEAVDPGSGPNGLSSGSIQLIDSLVFVSSVSGSSPTGGEDAESTEEYLDRLSEELELLAPRPILPTDFATLARRVPGVYRALGINGYNPGDATYNNERMVAVAVIDSAGAAVSSGVKTAVDTLLQAEREVNFVVHVIDPSFTEIDVVYTAVAKSGYLAADVEAAVDAALVSYLSPANWAGGDETPPAWRLEDKVRYLEVATVINNVEGVSHITALTVNAGTADVTLTGVAPLPTVGTITSTVT